MVCHVREKVGDFPIIEGKNLSFFSHSWALGCQSNKPFGRVENGFDRDPSRDEKSLLGVRALLLGPVLLFLVFVASREERIIE